MRFGIAFKLNLIVVATVMVLGGLLGTYFVVEEERALRAALDRRVRLLASQVVDFLGHELGENEPDELEITLDSIKDPEIAYVLVKSATGEVIAGRWGSEVRGGVTEYVLPILAAKARGDGVARESFGVIESAPGGVPVGTLALGVDLSGLRAHRQVMLRRTVAATAGAALVAALLGAWFVRFLLLRSLTPLLEGIRGLAGGDLARRVALAGRPDEIGAIGRAFNEMADRLAETLVTKGDLEATVARRTSELTEALRARQRAQEDLAEREGRVRLLLDSTAEAIYGIGTDGLCTFCNPACVRALGYSATEELIGRNMHELVHHSTADGKVVPEGDCPIYRTLRDRKGYHSEEEVLWRADGTNFPAELWAYPMARDGAPAGAVVTFLDLTERKRLEGELLKMRKLESLGVLAGGIAHDFNNLLMGILGNLTLAREELGNPVEATVLLREAEQATLRTRQLTQQLLTFSRGGAPVKKRISVRAIVEESSRFALSGSAVRGDQTFQPDLWAVEADAGQLGQVVHNLVINGVQAMPHGGVIRIATDNVELAAGQVVPLPAGRYVRIQVRDQGSGIPERHLPRIFDPYFTTKEGGHGLGLASVFSIATKHGGHVTVASAEGRGTVFEVYLPAAPAAGTVATPPGAPAPAAQRRLRVLVMDDEAPVLRVTVSMLGRLGHEVETATNGAAAVDVVRAAREGGRPFDLLLMDLTVPGGMGGVEALERIRAFEPGVVAIATSGYSNNPVIARFRDFGFAGSIAKPFTLDDLRQAMSATLAAPREDPHRG